MNQGSDEPILDVNQVAELLGWSPRTVRKHAFALGGRRRLNARAWKFKRSDVLIGSVDLGLKLPDELDQEAKRLHRAAMEQVPG